MGLLSSREDILGPPCLREALEENLQAKLFRHRRMCPLISFPCFHLHHCGSLSPPRPHPIRICQKLHTQQRRSFLLERRNETRSHRGGDNLGKNRLCDEVPSEEDGCNSSTTKHHQHELQCQAKVFTSTLEERNELRWTVPSLREVGDSTDFRTVNPCVNHVPRFDGPPISSSPPTACTR